MFKEFESKYQDKLFQEDVQRCENTVRAFILAKGTRLSFYLVLRHVIPFLVALNSLLLKNESFDLEFRARLKVEKYLSHRLNDLQYLGKEASPLLLLLIKCKYEFVLPAKFSDSMLRDIGSWEFDPDFIFQMARVMVSANRYNEAIPFYEKLIANGWFNEHPDDKLFFSRHYFFMPWYKLGYKISCVIS